MIITPPPVRLSGIILAIMLTMILITSPVIAGFSPHSSLSPLPIVLKVGLASASSEGADGEQQQEGDNSQQHLPPAPPHETPPLQLPPAPQAPPLQAPPVIVDEEPPAAEGEPPAEGEEGGEDGAQTSSPPPPAPIAPFTPIVPFTQQGQQVEQSPPDTTSPDSTIKNPFLGLTTMGPDGTITTIDPDGNLITLQTPPGKGLTTMGPDRTKTTTYRDGSVVIQHPDGGIVLQNPRDWIETKLIRDPPMRITTYPDGSSITEFDDGDLGISIPDVGDIILRPDGTSIITEPGDRPVMLSRAGTEMLFSLLLVMLVAS